MVPLSSGLTWTTRETPTFGAFCLELVHKFVRRGGNKSISLPFEKKNPIQQRFGRKHGAWEPHQVPLRRRGANGKSPSARRHAGHAAFGRIQRWFPLAGSIWHSIAIGAGITGGSIVSEVDLHPAQQCLSESVDLLHDPRQRQHRDIFVVGSLGIE
jgi:hypothetical protein